MKRSCILSFYFIITSLFFITCTKPPTAHCPIQNLKRNPDHALYHIDEINGQAISDSTKQPILVNGEFLEIKGWAVDTEAKDVPQTIYFQIGEKHYENTFILKRPDVAQALSMSKVENAGYYFKLPTVDIGKGVYDVKLIVVQKGNNRYYNPNPQKTVSIDVQPPNS